MTAIAATTGTIRSRVDGTLVMTIEFEPGQAQDAFKLFAAPGTQVAIAALKDGSFLEQPIAKPASESCQCEACVPQGDFMHSENMRMIVCATCGNKRCPHATDHRNLCTGSNDVGQKGSSWEGVKPREQLGDACYRTVLWCNEPSFWDFLSDAYPDSEKVKNSKFAAFMVRWVCGVESRKELDTDNEANKTWHREIRQPYADYLKRLEATQT